MSRPRPHRPPLVAFPPADPPGGRLEDRLSLEVEHLLALCKAIGSSVNWDGDTGNLVTLLEDRILEHLTLLIDEVGELRAQAAAS